jgi:two-component sensor histidine kinase
MKWAFNSQWRLGGAACGTAAYSAAVLGVLLATIITHALAPLQTTPTVPFTAVIVLSAWLYGRGPAILAIVLSVLAVDYFFLPPIGSVLTGVTSMTCVFFFTFVAALVCYLQENNRWIEARVQERTADLIVANQSLTSEIEERRRAEAALKESEAKLLVAVAATEAGLREKEVLLRELQHRVKNNLQIITSLLSLQRGKVKDETSRELFKECQQRVRTIAMVHDRLYRAPSFARFDLEAYFRELVQSLLQCYCASQNSVTPRIVVEQAAVKFEQLIPCALIVNELVCNALKYAFPDGRPGEVTVDIRRQDGQVMVRVADNGVGFSSAGSPSLSGVGQKIVHALVEQLSGKLQWSNGRGTSATVTFCESN